MATPLDYQLITPFQRLMITASSMAATILITLDMTIANVALPNMQGSLSASRDQISWVLTTYTVSTALGIPLAGWLADRHGRKIVLLGGILGFTLASCACGMAESMFQIVVARALQGFLGAGLMSLPQAAIMDAYPPEKMARGITIFSTGTLLGSVSGPTLGGLLTEYLNWRWVFYVNLPIGLLAFAGMFIYLPKSRADPAKKFDSFGFVSLSLALACLQALLDRGEQLDWFDSTEIRFEACGALISFCYFLVHAFTTPAKPFLNLNLFSNVNFMVGTIGNALVAGIIAASRTMFPLMLQGLFHFPTVYVGLALSPTGLGAVVAALVHATFQQRIDQRFLCAGGLLLLSFALWYVTRYDMAPAMADIAWPSFLQGVGFMTSSLAFVVLAYATVPPELRNEATSIIALVRNFCSGAAIAITQIAVSHNGGTMRSSLVESVNPYTPYAASPYLPLPFDIQSISGLTLIDEVVSQQASMVAYLDSFKLLMLASLAAAFLALIVRPARQTGPLVAIE